ncbi:MAG: hypothetical protein ACFFCE_01395 [Promethearchaeota archaeon]
MSLDKKNLLISVLAFIIFIVNFVFSMLLTIALFDGTADASTLQLLISVLDSIGFTPIRIICFIISPTIILILVFVPQIDQELRLSIMKLISLISFIISTFFILILSFLTSTTPFSNENTIVQTLLINITVISLISVLLLLMIIILTTIKRS